MIKKRKVIQVTSPGRINVIGEHIDYNGGMVMPAAIDKSITLTISTNNTSICKIKSLDFDAEFQVDLNKIQPSATEWHNYIIGVIYNINQLKPGQVCGFDCVIKSNLPIGSGISSSAALECGIAKGLDSLFDLNLSPIQIIKLSQKAEHDFVGTKCGIMDQFSVVYGIKNHFILLNCKNLEYKQISADLNPYQIVLFNSNVSHNLATSAYNTRVEECNIALKTIKKKYPKIKFLTELEPDQILEFKDDLNSEIYNRALFVSQENQRVIDSTEALHKKNLKQFGSFLYESHQGLSKLYQVSCTELDFMVEFSKNFDYVLGSRMMGGGFGGCTLNLIHKEKVDQYILQITKAYEQKFNLKPTPIKITAGNGVTVKNMAWT